VNSNNIKVSTSTVREHSMLVLLMGEFVRNVVEMAPGDTIDIRFIKIGSGIQIIESLLPKRFERLQCWYC
jgi:hypothetical protein